MFLICVFECLVGSHEWWILCNVSRWHIQFISFILRVGKSLPSLSFSSREKTAGNLREAWSQENTKEKVLVGPDLRPAGIFMASGLWVLTTTSTLNTILFYCHTLVMFSLFHAGLMFPYCLLSEVNRQMSCCVSEMYFSNISFYFSGCQDSCCPPL